MLTVLIVLAIVVFLGFKLIEFAIHFADRNVGAFIVLRWLIGHHRDKTNATFLHAGTKITAKSGRASRWAHLPGYQRMAIRWLVIGIIAGSLYGYFTTRTLTEAALICGGLVLVLYGQYRGYRTYKLATHKRSTLNPLTLAVGEQLGMSSKAAADSVSLRPDYTTVTEADAHLGTIVLPDNWRPDQEEAMTALLHSRLGSGINIRYRTSKAPFTVEITRSPIPATMVRLPDMLDAIKELPTDKVLLGLTGRGEHKLWDMSNEDPHCLVSANTRRGKTRLLLLISAQVLAQGAELVTIIDPKDVGVDEALAGVPGVKVLNDSDDVEAMWQGIRDFRAMMRDRITAYKADRTLEFSRALLVVDELSQFSAMSKAHWSKIKDPKDKATPPIFDDLAAILWQGAQFKCSVLVFGQRIEHSTLGGLIDSFGTRLLAGYTKRTYERLIGITPILQSSKVRGRFVHFDGDNPEYIQTVLGKDQELRDLAMSGRKPSGKVIQLTAESIESERTSASRVWNRLKEAFGIRL